MCSILPDLPPGRPAFVARCHFSRNGEGYCGHLPRRETRRPSPTVAAGGKSDRGVSCCGRLNGCSRRLPRRQRRREDLSSGLCGRTLSDCATSGRSNGNRRSSKLREEAQRLVEAWQHLEDEQRELMLRQATIRSVPGPVLPETDAYSENGPLHPVRLSPAGAVAAVGAEIGGVGRGGNHSESPTSVPTIASRDAKARSAT